MMAEVAQDPDGLDGKLVLLFASEEGTLSRN
jgi:hypothetical protein